MGDVQELRLVLTVSDFEAVSAGATLRECS
jgi:hypothetical protein